MPNLTTTQIARRLKTTSRRIQILAEIEKGAGPGRIDLALRALMKEGMLDHSGAIGGWYVTDTGRQLLDDAINLGAGV